MTRRAFGRRQRRTHAGFGLLEALVALAIAAISFTALYRTVGQSSKVVLDVDQRIEAVLLARSVLASATFADDLGPLQSGQAGPLRWRLRVDPQAVIVSALGRSAIEPHPTRAARVEVSVERADTGSPVLAWAGWKPYRGTP